MTVPVRLTSDEEFALVLDGLAASALADGAFADADYLWTAADWHAEPSEATLTARMLLLTAAVSRVPGERAA